MTSQSISIISVVNMNFLVYLLYLLILLLIYFHKWVEFQFLKLLTPWLKRKGKEICARIGVVLHCPDDPEWSEADNEKVLSKCKRYDTLVHLKINDNSFFPRMANMGTLASGEMYMEKILEYTKSEEDIVEYAKRVLENNLLDLYWNKWNRFLEWLELDAFNLQTKQRSLIVGKEHFDLGNDLYELMLDSWMQYTCGYWAKADNLNEAQEHKLDLIARKLDLKPGMRVLDIGCGWGMLCKYLAEKHGVECVGVTISKEGAEYGQKICKGLPVEIRFQDYRDVKDTFDRVVSIGCMEHIGKRNHREFFEVAHRCLNNDGIFLLHNIGTMHKNMPRSERWIHKYIFPNGSLPKVCDITEHSYGLFIMEDFHNFGPDYAKTLNAWRQNFNKNWDQIKHKYDEKFYRMWIFYLTTCESLFLSRRAQLWQVVFSKDGLQNGYGAPR